MFIKKVSSKKLTICLLLLVILLLLLFHNKLTYSVSVVSNQVKALPIYSVELNDDDKRIAISFDATWGSTYTRDILDILDQHNIKTTFFLVNIWMEDNNDMTKEIAKRGHEIGLHSTTHPKFTSLSDQEIVAELEDNQRMIKSLTGKESKIFRLPFGDYDNRVITKVNELGFSPVQWTIDSLDWKDLSAADISARVLKAKSGYIILLHNNGTNTAMALKTILPELIKKGYKIVPVSELIYHDNYYINPNGVQCRITN